ncbi:MAG: hypothetical protein WDO68_28865 [Gammaproteobacteria bacterium]
MKVTGRLLAAAAASAILLGAGLASPVARAADQKSDKANEKKVSKAASKPLKAAKDAADAKKYPEALESLKQAEALPDKTPYDVHVTNELYGFVYVRTQQYAEAAKALEAGLTDGFLEEAEVQSRLKALAQVNYQIKNYDKAIEFGNRVVKAGQADDDMITLVSQAYYIKGDYPGTIKFVSDYNEGLIKAGKTPKEQSLNLVLSSCLKQDDNECATKALERMVSFYPKPDYWQNLLYSLFQQEGQTDKSLLQVYRLAAEVDVLKRPDDYTEFAQLAIEAGSPGEAQWILEKGMAKNVFTDPKLIDRNKRLLENAKKQAEQDRASLDKIAKGRGRRQDRRQGREHRTCVPRLQAVRQGGRGHYSRSRQARCAEPGRSEPAARYRAARRGPQGRRAEGLQRREGRRKARAHRQPVEPARPPGVRPKR